MSLRSTAEADLAVILEDDQFGFGWQINLTSPDSLVADLVGYSDDISQVIDPDTGVAVSGRLASAVFRISSLIDAGFVTLPIGVMDSSKAPWVVKFADINGNAGVFKVREGNPDRMLGIIACTLELYR